MDKPDTNTRKRLYSVIPKKPNRKTGKIKTKAKKKVHSIRLIAFCLSNSAFVGRFLLLLEVVPFFVFFVLAIAVLYHVFKHEKRETSLS